MLPMDTNVRRVHDVLVALWDPLSVRDHPRAENEYVCFARTIRELLRERRSADALFAYLRWAAERMGMPGPQEVLRPVVTELLQIGFQAEEAPLRWRQSTPLCAVLQAV